LRILRIAISSQVAVLIKQHASLGRFSATLRTWGRAHGEQVLKAVTLLKVAPG